MFLKKELITFDGEDSEKYPKLSVFTEFLKKKIRKLD